MDIYRSVLVVLDIYVGLLQVGKHGILIEFEDGHGVLRSATYLPEVAHEQGSFYRNGPASHACEIEVLLRT